MILGVCNTLEKNTGIDAWLFRILFIILTLTGGYGIIIYLILSFIL